MPTLAVNASLSGMLDNSGSVYTTVQSAASGIATQDPANPEIANSKSGATFYIYRSVLVFDTSALPSGVIITAAVISLYGQAKDVATAFNVDIVSGTDLADTLVAADYGDLLDDTTSFGSITSTAWTVSAWNDITLNATGIAAIVKAGITRFGIRNSLDIAISEPTAFNYVQFVGLGYGTDAKITITYTAGEGAGIIAVVETRFHYVDAEGTERFILGTPVV